MWLVAWNTIELIFIGLEFSTQELAKSLVLKDHSAQQK